ncbi:MAG: formimidoylglutamase [Proteobacteria bacterium]|nr:formimidoylglutamase [Pseudomonadota bacterium]
MSNRIDMSVWQGRVDSQETASALRWHQAIAPFDDAVAPGSRVLLGFACDEGVKRNKGRIGACGGPLAIRAALANLSYEGDGIVYDAGDVRCLEHHLEQAQVSLARTVAGLLDRQMNVTVLGGGHEIAWGSFQGVVQYLHARKIKAPSLGIINFDAHFDLRNPIDGASSGTPFRQMAQWCVDHDLQFNYHVIGINPSANSAALFDYAKSANVSWVEDVDVHLSNRHALEKELRVFIRPLDYLYVTICLDVFKASVAPGVSAPASVGVSGEVVIKLVRAIRLLAADRNVPIILSDIAEMNPNHDLDQRTARLAARLVWELCR